MDFKFKFKANENYLIEIEFVNGEQYYFRNPTAAGRFLGVQSPTVLNHIVSRKYGITKEGKGWKAYVVDGTEIPYDKISK